MFVCIVESSIAGCFLLHLPPEQLPPIDCYVVFLAKSVAVSPLPIATEPPKDFDSQILHSL
jgi:hypothetical protein